jgi:hypothetical protein
MILGMNMTLIGIKLKINMKKLIRRLEWWVDYHIGYMLCNPANVFRYHEYMIDKYGKEKYLNMK